MKALINKIFLSVILLIGFSGCYTVLYNPNSDNTTATYDQENTYSQDSNDDSNWYRQEYYGDYDYYYHHPWWLGYSTPSINGNGGSNQGNTSSVRNEDGSRNIPDRRILPNTINTPPPSINSNSRNNSNNNVNNINSSNSGNNNVHSRDESNDNNSNNNNSSRNSDGSRSSDPNRR